MSVIAYIDFCGTVRWAESYNTCITDDPNTIWARVSDEDYEKYRDYDDNSIIDGAFVPGSTETVDELRDLLWLLVKEKCYTVRKGNVVVTTSLGTHTFQSRDSEVINLNSSIKLLDNSLPCPKFYTLDNHRKDFPRADLLLIGEAISELYGLCDDRKEAIRALLWDDSITTPEEAQAVYKANIDTGWPEVPYRNDSTD